MSAATTRSVAREVLAGHGRPEDFRHRAACRSVDPEVFFPVAEAGPELARQVGIAKAVCAGCPVRSECLTWALAHQPDGIAGGLTEQERRLENLRSRSSTARRLPATVPVAGTRREVAAAGQAAIAAGMRVGEAARVFAVSRRTADRWARSCAHAIRGEGALAATSAPSQNSHNTKALAGTRAVEGHRG